MTRPFDKAPEHAGDEGQWNQSGRCVPAMAEGPVWPADVEGNTPLRTDGPISDGQAREAFLLTTSAAFSPTRRTLCAFSVSNGVMSLCLAVSIIALWQWKGPNGWARMDRFSGGAMMVYAAIIAEHVRFVRRVMARGVSFSEAYGATYDPMMGVFNSLLLAGQVSVFLDYGHWHLAPGLERPLVQYAGLGLYLVSLLLLVTADRHLERGFGAGGGSLRLVTSGPYRYMRHPRYTALFLTNIALALTLASPLGWFFVILWTFVVARRVSIEERHLRRLFGARYERYAETTGAILPWRKR